MVQQAIVNHAGVTAPVSLLDNAGIYQACQAYEGTHGDA